ncbi:MAG: AMP-binding protein [Sandaracinaceae bacterium]|nr:AMP-binding protein [Sandaracinaceae bacterium]
MLPADTYASLGELLSDALVQWKRELALLEVDRKKVKRSMSYLDVHREVAKVAAWLTTTLAETEVRPTPPRIAVVLSNQARWLVSACAAFRVGAVLVPIDYKLSADEQLELLAHSKADLLVTELPLFKRFTAKPTIPVLLVDGAETDASATITAWDALPEASMPPLARRTREDIATIVYSSGTGGRPKGCMLSHRAYLAQLHALMALYPMRPGHRSFSILPTNHAIDFMVGFVGPFACGSTVVHQRTLRPEFLVSTMQDHAITHMAVVPVLLEAFERALDDKLAARPRWQKSALDVLTAVNRALTHDEQRPSLSRRLLGSVHEGFGGHLEVMFAGGAFVDRTRAQRFHALGLPVAIGYGLTECCTVATVQDLRPFRADSVGGPVEGVELRIAPLGDEPASDGVGEVWIRGETLMSGYLDDPELSAETITDDGWLKTGDLGWLDASRHLHLVGRAKNMVVTPGGKNVYPEDVEAAFEGIAGVDELCIFASGYVWPRREKLVDEGLFAVVRGKLEARALEKELTARNRKLPEHKRISAFVMIEQSFPRTASMKVKRQPLAERLRSELTPGGTGWTKLARAAGASGTTVAI